MKRKVMEILSPTPFSHSGIYDGVNPLPTMRPIKMTTMPCPNENKKTTTFERFRLGPTIRVIESIVAK